MSNPFEHFARINQSSKKPDEESLSTFNSFLADTYYSMYYDTVLLAELSSMMNVPDSVHEIFYRGVVDKGKRHHFWPKAEKEERIENLKKLFDVSHEKAREIEALIPNSKYSKMKELLK